MLSKIVIAPIGPQGSGKDYLTRAIKEHCGCDRVDVVSTGGKMRDIAKVLGMKQLRPICDRLVKALVTEFGGDVLANAILQTILDSQKQVVVYDCPRRLEDAVMLTRLRDSCKVITVYLDRPQEDRFKALQERGRDGELTWEAFLVNEDLPQEKHVRELGQRADSNLYCSGTPGELDLQKAAWCQTHLTEYAIQLENWT